MGLRSEVAYNAGAPNRMFGQTPRMTQSAMKGLVQQPAGRLPQRRGRHLAPADRLQEPAVTPPAAGSSGATGTMAAAKTMP